ncbi:unnamed protein product [Pylaiella littoralis]
METVIAGLGLPSAAVEVQQHPAPPAPPAPPPPPSAAAAALSCSFLTDNNNPTREAAAVTAGAEASATLFPGPPFSQPSVLLDVTAIAPPQGVADRSCSSSSSSSSSKEHVDDRNAREHHQVDHVSVFSQKLEQGDTAEAAAAAAAATTTTAAAAGLVFEQGAIPAATVKESSPSTFVRQGGDCCGVGSDGAGCAAAAGGGSAGSNQHVRNDHDVGEHPTAFSLRAATMMPTLTPLAGASVGDGDASIAFAAVAAVAAATAATAPGAAAIPVADSAVVGESNAAGSTSCLGDFNFSLAELNKMSKRYATVNTLGAGTPMPLLGWLTRELDINHHDLRSLILRHPRLMAYRVTSHVAPKMTWLRERLGLGQAALRKLVITYPAVLSRSVEKNLEPKFKWLEERLGATQEEVAMLIRRFPLIFGYSTTQNLEPTVSFFTGDMRGEQGEVRSAVMSCPSILSRSLEKRMVPRARLMREKEIEPCFGLHKWVVSTYTDAQFIRWLEGRGA